MNENTKFKIVDQELRQKHLALIPKEIDTISYAELLIAGLGEQDIVQLASTGKLEIVEEGKKTQATKVDVQ